MEDNKDETLRDKAENLKDSMTEKAEELRATAEAFAGKTMDAAEKLINDVFKKKDEVEVSDFEEEKLDPKDVEIRELKRERDEMHDKYIRLFADFDNFKKRNARERLEWIQTASKDVVKDLLPVLDDFERALKATENSQDVVAVREGLQLIYTKLSNTLASKGLKPMSTIGEAFNADLHEAITEIPAPTPEQAGKVMDELEKGYLLNEKIIRYAKVIVGKQSE